MNSGMYSGNTDQWETPQDLFDELDLIEKRRSVSNE